jgi:anthranilate phosphoribosyltransferase
MIQASFARLVERRNLSFDESRGALAEIFQGSVSPSLVAGFLTALRMKGETVDEIAGAASAMRDAAARVRLSDAPVIVDTCGTGGDKQGSFNISTAAALVVAGAGFTVAKHGNRSISSQCGSADVLEALGVRIDAPPLVAEMCLKEIGLAFLFAPTYHPAMKHAGPVRRELGIRTVFNVLGPLTNPAGADAQLIGVFSDEMVDVLAKVLVRLGTKHSMVVHGAGHDEITLSGATHAAEIIGGKIRRRRLTAKDFGLRPSSAASLRGGDKEANAAVIRRVLDGERGPARDAVVVNAAAALLVASRATGRRDVRNLIDARRLAETSLDSGAARDKLRRLADLTHEFLDSKVVAS